MSSGISVPSSPMIIAEMKSYENELKVLRNGLFRLLSYDCLSRFHSKLYTVVDLQIRQNIIVESTVGYKMHPNFWTPLKFGRPVWVGITLKFIIITNTHLIENQKMYFDVFDTLSTILCCHYL